MLACTTVASSLRLAAPSALISGTVGLVFVGARTVVRNHAGTVVLTVLSLAKNARAVMHGISTRGQKICAQKSGAIVGFLSPRP